ncbi:MAG: type III PLP-dependent enzyme [Thermodesulfovibrionia bacterium]
MLRTFKLEKLHTELVAKSTLFKALKYVNRKTIDPPLLLMDKEKIKEKVSLIGRNIRNSNVFYAVKANPDLEIIRLIDKLGLGFEIASEGELKMLASIGTNPEKIISSNPVKSLKFLKMVHTYGINYFSFDSVDEVNKLAKFAPRCNVYVRLSVPNEGSEWPLSKKFGVEFDEALTLLSYAKKKGLNPVGITFHVGSQCTNIYNWNTALDKAKALWDMAQKKNIKLDTLNIGGGYPINYTKNVVKIEAIEKNINNLIHEKFPRNIKILIEPGRAVVGDAGIFVTSVIGKARRADENWLYIDVGVFNGLMESIGGIKYSYLVESSSRTNYKKKWTITGPSCDSFDIIEKGLLLPEPDIGSLVLILSSGAYTISYASEFNGFPIPKTILI